MTHNLSKSVVVLLCASSVFSSQLISGSSRLQLSGPTTKEQNQQIRHAARVNLKKNIIFWFKEQQGITIDSTNSLDNLSVDQYIDSCMQFTKEENAFHGKTMVTTLLLTYESAEIALKNHNAATDIRAIESWKSFKQAQENKDFQKCYFDGIRTIAAANAHFGPPLIIPESEGKPLIDIARTATQQVLDRMKVISSDMIIQGKPGHLIAQPPFIAVAIDSSPIAGVWFTGKFSNGKEILTQISDENGKINFTDFRIPFVNNGALMYVVLNPGKIIGSPTLISAKDLGLKLKNSQDQTFIIKINRPFYTLNFKAASVGKITMPPDFAKDTHVKKFLYDSCYMQETAAGSNADLEITVNAQVSDYNYDETEEVGIKANIYVSIKGLTYNPPISSENTIVFEKRYERSVQIPYGLYFWLANSKIREQIQNTISQL